MLFFVIAAFAQISHAEVNGKIISAAGEVTINGKPAKIGDAVSFGDELVVGGKSSCEIVVSDDSIIKIQNNARIIFNMTDSKESAIDIVKGWFSAIFKKKNVSVKTPTVIAGVRGTMFCINVENEKSVYTCTCNGTIDWKCKDRGEVETITAVHHEGRYFKLRDGKIVSSVEGGRYHKDKDLEALAAKINAKIDWGKAE